MPVDRGELQYKISVEDAFSTAIDKFTAGIGAAGAAWSGFKATFGAASLGFREAQADLVGVSQGARAAANSAKSAFGDLENSVDRANRSLSALRQGMERIPAGAGQVSRELRGSTRAVNEQTKAFNSLTASIQRSFRQFVLFQVFRQVTNAIRGTVKAFEDTITAGVRFNAEIETATRGAAGLFVTVGQIRDITTGELVTGAQAFTLALGESERQMKLLRQDALQTGASAKELGQAFQSALGPGLASKLSVDQIRTFAVEISRAAQSIGLSQNQLSEEVRSILSGNVTRNTRIAQVLGITSADIKAAKDRNQLFDFLQKKLSGFNAVAGETAGTFDNLAARVQNAFNELLGAGTQALFENLKVLLSDTFKLLTQPLDGGLLAPNQTVVTIVQGISSALSEVVKVLDTIVLHGDVVFKLIASLPRVAENFGTSISEVARVVTEALFPSFGLIRQIFINLPADSLRAFEGVVRSLDARALGDFLAGALRISFDKGLLEIQAQISITFNQIKVTIFQTLAGAFQLAATAAHLTFEVVFNGILSKIDGVVEHLKTLSALAGSLGFNQIAEAINQAATAIKNARDNADPFAKVISNAADTSEKLAIANAKAADSIREQTDRAKGALDNEQKGLLLSLQQQTIERQRVRQLDDILEQQRKINVEVVQPTFLDQVIEGLQAKFKGLTDSVQATVSVIVGITNRAASEISSLIVDAFDPTKKVDIRARFAALMRDVAKIIIDELIKIAVAKAILGLTNILGGGSGAGPTIGKQITSFGPGIGASSDGSSFISALPSVFAKGGEVPSHGWPGPRPKNVPASDTVAAWLTPNEFVHRRDAVSRYGLRVMHAINEGLIDPFALRALAGARPSPVKRSGGPGYVGGGLVTDKFARSAGDSGSAQGGKIFPVLAVDSALMERMIAAGEGPLERWHQRNASKLQRHFRGRK